MNKRFKCGLIFITLLFTLACAADAQELVQNGGFESGDFSLFIQSGNTNTTFVSTNALYAHSGAFGAQLGPSGSLGFLTRNLATTPGQTYNLSFWLDSPDGKTNSEFRVAWNGTNLYDQTNLASNGWTHLVFPNLLATGSSTPLQFGFFNTPSYFGLDEIIVTNTAAVSPSSAAYTFSTFAGYTGIGSADGIGGAAQFSSPDGITVDSSGNLYVVDFGSDTIRKVTPAGVVSTLAGQATYSGTNDGVGSAARFGNLGYGGPNGIAMDNSGNLYVADTFNNTIRELSPVGTNWVVTTIAGQLQVNFIGGLPIGGTNDGIGAAIQFNAPASIAVDSATNIYVADSKNFTIRKLTPVGSNWLSSTIAGKAGTLGTMDGANGGAQFSGPFGVALDPSGNLYAADYYSVRKVAHVGTNWVVTTLAGLGGQIGFTNAAGANARFSEALSLAVDASTNIYVGDYGNALVRKVALVGTNWNVTTLAGNASGAGSANGTGTNAFFNSPTGVTVDNTGKVYVSDFFNSEIRRITSGGIVTTIAGSAPTPGANDGSGAGARFNLPASVAVDNAGNVYVADTGNDTIRVITSAGIVSTPFGVAGISGATDAVGNNARFNQPNGVAVDNAGDIYVADTGNNTIRAITPDGSVATIAGLANTQGTNNGLGSNARFYQPSDIAVDSQTNLFVIDSGNATVRELTRSGPSWNVITIAGSAGNFGTNDGAGFGAQFGNDGHRPGVNLVGALAISVDNSGNVYVADTDNNEVRKLTHIGTNWVVTTFSHTVPHQFGIAADANGNVFTANDSQTIQKLTPAGAGSVATTIGGVSGSFGSQDGAGAAARFNNPTGLAFDKAGNLYVADSRNNTIRKGVFTQFTAANSALGPNPPLTGSLQVTLLPPEAGGQWRFPWEVVWHNSGFTAGNLAPGNYPVEFRVVSGWLAIPAYLTTTNPAVVSASGITQITNNYFPTVASSDASSAAGSLTVYLGANPPIGAGWRFLGDTNAFFASNFATNLSAGTYLIEFAGPFVGRATPPNVSVQISAGQPALIAVTYPFAAAPPGGALLPTPVPANNIGDVTDYPFAFNGRLQTDVGFGSGVAVQTNVVLSVAHLVFNDTTLSYANGAYWFLQDEVPTYVPSPLTARGWYLLSGYAAQRTNDLSSGNYGPGISSPDSRNLDVAALYFNGPVADGGFGGYLPSDQVPNQWLTGNAEKMLVGYPIDGSQYGFTNILPGAMYQIGPQPYALSLSADSTTNQQEVYTASWFLSYPGNSGGPLYVQLNGYYYPAGIYLGTLNGQSVVRGIDSNVVNLITLAATLGDAGANTSGGGVVTVIPNQTLSAGNPGYLQIQLQPPSAVQAGAAWLLQPSTNYSTATNFTQAIFSTNALTLKFKVIPGWNLPTNQSISVSPGTIAKPVAFYTVFNPKLVANNQGLGLSGTTNTTYRIEQTASLKNPAWTGLSTNTIVNGNFTLVVPATNTSTTFYRAVWLNR